MAPRTLAVHLAFTVGLTVSAATANANPWEMYGFNARAIGMANAHTAYANDFTAVYYNPGALTTDVNPGFGFGYTFASPELSFSFARPNPQIEALEPSNSDGITFGARLPLGSRRVVLGMALNVPTSSLLSGQALDPSVPHWYMVQGLPRRIVAALGLGVRPHPLIGIGAAVQVLAGVEGQLNYRVDPETGAFSRASAIVDIKPVAAPIIGLELGRHRGLRLGLTWRGPIETSVDLPLDLDLTGMTDLALSSLFTVQYNPHQLSVGVSFTWSNLDLTADMTWAFWSAAPDPARGLQLEVDGERAGGPSPEPLVSLGFSDVLIPRIGVERRVREFAFRAGYSLRPSPAPRQTSGSNYVDGLSHVFSFGSGVALRNPAGLRRGRLSIDLGVSLLWYPRRAHSKTLQDDPVGSFTASGVTAVVALSLRYAFGIAPPAAKPRRPPTPPPGDGTWQPRGAKTSPLDRRRAPWLP